MFNSVSTIKGFFSAEHHVAHVNQFANARLFSVETVLGGKNVLICTFTVDDDDYFILTTVHGSRKHVGIGEHEFAQVLKAEGLLHLELKVE
jgi:hypothetical protein